MPVNATAFARFPGRWIIAVILVGGLLPACVNLSNRADLERFAPFQGVQSIAVFIQHWPVYLQKSGRNDLGEDFIKPQTIFFGSWQRAAKVPPRAVDVQDLDTGLVGQKLVGLLEQKGYKVLLASEPLEGSNATVESLMAQYQESHTPVDAFLFCYFAPTLFVSQARDVPQGHASRSYSLEEIVAALSPGTDAVIWVGERDQRSPAQSISHAFIYWAMTIFRASDGRTIMAQADARTGGPVRPWIPRCPPPPTDKNYPASPEIIKVLMLDNFKCRLRQEIPYAFNP